MAHSEPQATLERRIRVRTGLQALDGDVGEVAETARFASSILLLTALCTAALGAVIYSGASAGFSGDLWATVLWGKPLPP